jgi:SAM-dependent methyltransferase
MHWNDRTDVHLASSYYDIAGFRRDGPRPIFGPDEDEVGPVTGQRLLHLQCHIGLDSLRWSALGASVTGIDISDRSIEVARRLAAESNLAVTFVRSDVHDLSDVLEEQFDIVYASGGVICWIPDLHRWAAIAAGLLRPGGVFYLSDGHPLSPVPDPAAPGGWVAEPGYFGRGATRFVDAMSYTDGDGLIGRPVNYRWRHTIGDVVTAVATAGLRIEFLHEHPWCPRQRHVDMIQDDRGRWHIPGDPHPLGFSVRAVKPDRP